MAVLRTSFTQQLGQKLAGVRCLARRNLLGGATGDQFAALVASLRAEVDDIIGRFDHVQVVLDHHHRMPMIDQPVQAFQQPIDVGEVQTGRRLVQDVQVVFTAFQLSELPGELGKLKRGKHNLYILDEPTTGLHFADIDRLLESLNRLVDNGHSVVVIEHNLDVIKTADYVIDLGPEGGHKGGQLIACGTPEEIAACKASYTGKFLAKLFV